MAVRVPSETTVFAQTNIMERRNIVKLREVLVHFETVGRSGKFQKTLGGLRLFNLPLLYSLKKKKETRLLSTLGCQNFYI